MNPSIVTTPARWFVRGFSVGILMMGSVNALSYFLRSEHWGNLLGTTPNHREALGFPMELWESGNAFGGYFVDLPAMLVNMLCAAGFGVLCGWITLRYRVALTRLVEGLERTVTLRKQHKVQFSLGSLLLATGLAALAAAGARYARAGRPEVLAAIYVLGPWILVLIAYLPLGASWQQRIWVLIPTMLLLMAAAVIIGMRLEPQLEFDKVLLGIFICWTPQSVLAATGLTTVLLYAHFTEEDADSIKDA